MIQSPTIRSFPAYQNVAWNLIASISGGGGSGPTNPLITDEGDLFVTDEGDYIIYEE